MLNASQRGFRLSKMTAEHQATYASVLNQPGLLRDIASTQLFRADEISLPVDQARAARLERVEKQLGALVDEGVILRDRGSREMSRTWEMGWQVWKDFDVEHKAFQGAHARCSNPKTSNWKHYGGRGIKFLFKSFDEFFAELGPRPKGLTLDRIDNNGNYEPGNVRWTTPKKQRANQREYVYTAEGIKTFRETGRKLGSKYGPQNGRKAAATPGHMSRIGSISGRNNANSGQLARAAVLGGRAVGRKNFQKINHNRWHVKRGFFNSACALCRASLKLAAWCIAQHKLSLSMTDK
jgi:hypothetical protein